MKLLLVIALGLSLTGCLTLATYPDANGDPKCCTLILSTTVGE